MSRRVNLPKIRSLRLSVACVSKRQQRRVWALHLADESLSISLADRCLDASIEEDRWTGPVFRLTLSRSFGLC